MQLKIFLCIASGYLHADTFELTGGDCGHLSFLCESEALRDKFSSVMD